MYLCQISVLQQTTNHIAITKDELLSPIKDIPSPFPSCEMNKLEICEKDQGSNSDVCSSSSINKPKIHLMPVSKSRGRVLIDGAASTKFLAITI
uniref:Uncharacterized protein n=1 Tax=Megaselia scalaris TaxID=36166 RepID=T1GFR2_MEGSC